jgi:hypothetical protein
VAACKRDGKKNVSLRCFHSAGQLRDLFPWPLTTAVFAGRTVYTPVTYCNGFFRISPPPLRFRNPFRTSRRCIAMMTRIETRRCSVQRSHPVADFCATSVMRLFPVHTIVAIRKCLLRPRDTNARPSVGQRRRCVSVLLKFIRHKVISTVHVLCPIRAHSSCRDRILWTRWRFPLFFNYDLWPFLVRTFNAATFGGNKNDHVTQLTVVRHRRIHLGSTLLRCTAVQHPNVLRNGIPRKERKKKGFFK